LDETADCSTALQSLGPDKNPLHHLHEALKHLHSTLSSSPTVRDKLLWPFKKDDLEKPLQTIDHLTGLLKLALEGDHIALSRQIHSDIQPVKSNAEQSNRKALLD
jgi:hypothetical protein